MKKIIFYIFFLLSIQCLAKTNSNAVNIKKLDVSAELIYLQARGNPAIYAVIISGLQPYNPSWSDQIINMSYAPGFEIAAAYQPSLAPEKIELTWEHLNVTKTVSTNVPGELITYPNGFTNYYSVAPTYDMGPDIFGIKSATGSNEFGFENVSLNADHLFTKSHKIFNRQLKADFFGGLDFIKITQTLTSTFFNNQGFPETPLSYALAPDPAYRFVDKYSSKYWGIGPDLGINLTYGDSNGLQILSKSSFSLTCGNISSQDNFNGTSSNNPYTGPQSLSIPNNQTIIVPGFESKLGIGFMNKDFKKYHISLQAGYRVASYLDAIWLVKPTNLVLPGLFNGPEVATANMNIRAQGYDKDNFTLNGPYLNLLIKFS